MSKHLTQVIVNTKGLARIVTQSRDELGRFKPGAAVTSLMFANSALDRVRHSAQTVVAVQHSYGLSIQTVSSVNRTTKRGNCVTFYNDGSPVGSTYSGVNLFETEVR